MRTPKGSLIGVALVLAFVPRTSLAEGKTGAAWVVDAADGCREPRFDFRTRPDPQTFPLHPTQHAPGARASMTLTQPSSPFGIRVDVDGRQTYRITVQVDRLRRRQGASYVAWVATPELDQYQRLGTIGDANRLEGSVGWNQFLVFVSEETNPDLEHWSGPIVLTGISPSGRMHTMAGHGPFDEVRCADIY